MNDVDQSTGMRAFEDIVAEPGDVLISEGKAPPGLFVLLQGEVSISAKGVALGKAGAGDLIGEMALFDHGASSASVFAETPVKTLFLTRQAYDGLRDVVHPVAAAIEKATLHLQSLRLRQAGDRIAARSAGTPFQANRPTERFFSAVTALFGRGGRFSADRVDTLGALSRSPLFEGASNEALGQIADVFQAQAFGPGAFVCTEGERGDSMYLLDEGEIDVLVSTRDDRVEPLATLRPGAMFGAISLVEDRPRMCSCVAKGRVVVNALNREGYAALVDHPWYAGSLFRRAMIQMFAGQLAEANDQLAVLESQSLAEQTLTHLRKAAIGMTRSSERIH